MTELIRLLSKEMGHYIRNYSYDDFLYLSLALSAKNYEDSALHSVNYLDLSLVDEHRAGDCTQLSHHFARNVLDPLSINWKWLVSSDSEYDNSYKFRLIPFRSTAIQASVSDSSEFVALYIGIPLGHERPIPIEDGAIDKFWDKQYLIKTIDTNRFRLHTRTRSIDRYREYYSPGAIDFEAAWKSLVFVKENYSITTYFEGIRHFLGYDLLDNRVYYTLRTGRVRSKPLHHFLTELDKNWAQFDDQFRSRHLRETLFKIDKHQDWLRSNLAKHSKPR